MIDSSTFKAYDIRGTVPTQINEDFAMQLGLAFGRQARQRGELEVAVGRDGRLSSPVLAAALADGLAAAGMQVLDIGLATTPMLYYATHTLCRSGIQVTGSHNPAADNGFKLVLQQQAMHGDAIQSLRQAMGKPADVRARGSCRTVEVLPDYLARIRSDIRLARPMRVLVDCGNGVAGASAPEVLRAIGCDVLGLYTEVDGRFPNHHPDPGRPENLQDLRDALKVSDAELGLAFDGDGDRLGVLTRQGRLIYPDRLLMLLAQDVLRRQPGASVVFDVKCSQQLAPAIRAAGGVPVMHRTGHSLVKAKMRELQAPLAGEMSGHLFFGERWYGFDDATYAACRLLEILSRHADASAVLDALPDSCSTPEINLPCPPDQARELIVRLQDLAQRQFGQEAQVSTVDGVRVDWPQGFGLIRASNTTPVLVLRFEGDTSGELQRIRGVMSRLLADAAWQGDMP